MIKINEAMITYDKFKLGPINLSLETGEFISVVGKSGSGKSTLIKLITGHVKAGQGSIEYIDCSSQGIMYISQMGTTFNHLSIRENLKLKYDYSDKRMEKALEKVALDAHYLEKYPFQLSGGERQRIDLVRAILSNSKYIVLDESMSALDAENKKSISTLLGSFVSSGEITIIYITHDVLQAIEHSSRIIEIDNGVVKFDGEVIDYQTMKAGEDNAACNITFN